MFDDRTLVAGSEEPKSSRSVRTNLSTKTKRSSKSSLSSKPIRLVQARGAQLARRRLV